MITESKKVSSKQAKLEIKGDSIHLRLSHPNGKERVTVGTKKTLREFKTFLVSKLKLRCHWDTLKIFKTRMYYQIQAIRNSCLIMCHQVVVGLHSVHMHVTTGMLHSPHSS